MSEHRDVVVFIDRQEAKVLRTVDDEFMFFAGRAHRHEILPKESARHLNVPFKS